MALGILLSFGSCSGALEEIFSPENRADAGRTIAETLHYAEEKRLWREQVLPALYAEERKQAVEDIEMLTNCTAQVFVSTLSDLNEAIDKYYGKK